MAVQCSLRCQIGSGGPAEISVRPHQKSVSSQNSLVKVLSWQSSLWVDALYFDYGSPLGPALKDNQFYWACTKKQRLPNHSRSRQ